MLKVSRCHKWSHGHCVHLVGVDGTHSPSSGSELCQRGPAIVWDADGCADGLIVRRWMLCQLKWCLTDADTTPIRACHPASYFPTFCGSGRNGIPLRIINRIERMTEDFFFNEYCNRWVRELVKNFHHIKHWRRAICFSAEPECFSWRWQLRSAAKSIRLVIFRNWVGHKKKMENWNVVPCLKQAKRAESTSGFGGVSDRPAIYFIQKKLKFGSPLFNGFDSIRRKMWCNVMEQLHSMAALWRIGRKCTRSWSIRGEFPSSILVLRRKWETFRIRSFMEVVKLEYFF